MPMQIIRRIPLIFYSILIDNILLYVRMVIRLKIGLFTLDSRNNNYGGLLQEYALFVVLQKLGYCAEVIDYDVSTELNTFSYKRSIKYLSWRKISKKIHRIITHGKSINSTIPNEASRMLFDEFRRTYLTLSKRFSYGDLGELKTLYDCFVCGSDQIWNPSYNVPSFFLDFAGEKKKIIYAASIGVSSLTLMEQVVYKQLLTGLEHISVRENKAKDIIEGIAQKQVKVVLDPTMLLEKKDWFKFIKKDIEYKSYMFCYFLRNDKSKIRIAKKIAAKNKLQIVSVPFEHCVFSENEFPTYCNGMGPIEFLNLIYNARFVLTDSFHASVFSIVFDKPFYVFGRDSGKNNMNERLYTLLNLINRMDLFVNPNDINSISLEKDICYDFSEIIRARDQSIKWLESSLKN